MKIISLPRRTCARQTSFFHAIMILKEPIELNDLQFLVLGKLLYPFLRSAEETSLYDLVESRTKVCAYLVNLMFLVF